VSRKLDSGRRRAIEYRGRVGTRAYLLSLPFAPHTFGEKPPSGTVAFARHSLPFFWATLFDAQSIVCPHGGSIHGLAAPRLEALWRCERRLRHCAEHLGWSSWPLADRWLEFLLSLEQPWIAVDVDEIDHGVRELSEVLRRVALDPDDLVFRDYFGRFVRDRPSEEGVLLAGVDHEDYTPPRPLARLRSAAPPALAPPAVVPPAQASSGPQFVWRDAVEGLLADRDPMAWTRWFPAARMSSFRSDVAMVAPGAFIWYEPEARAWSMVIASCEGAAMKVLGMPVISATFPPLAPGAWLAAQVVEPSMVTVFDRYAMVLSSRRAACSSRLRRLA
jgi:hypothetical protein